MGSLPRGISASRGAAVLGVSQWSTPVQIWTQIMEDIQPGFCVAHGFEPPEPVDNAAVRWGSAFEDAVIDQAEILRGEKIGAREAFFQVADVTVPRVLRGGMAGAPVSVPITCHVDGIYGVQAGPARADTPLHEGKTTSAFSFREKWGEPGSDRIPREYAIQTQHQLMCTGAERVIVSVLVFPTRVEEFEKAGSFVRLEDIPDGLDGAGVIDPRHWVPMLAEMGFFHQYEVAADKALQAVMLERYRQFWSDYVLTETPPPLETWDDVKRIVTEPKGTVIATEEQERWASEYAQINGEIGHAKKQQDRIKALMISAIDMTAEHPLDDDSVEAIVLRSSNGRRIAAYSKEGKTGKKKKVFRCNG